MVSLRFFLVLLEYGTSKEAEGKASESKDNDDPIGYLETDKFYELEFLPQVKHHISRSDDTFIIV